MVPCQSICGIKTQTDIVLQKVLLVKCRGSYFSPVPARIFVITVFCKCIYIGRENSAIHFEINERQKEMRKKTQRLNN